MLLRLSWAESGSPTCKQEKERKKERKKKERHALTSHRVQILWNSPPVTENRKPTKVPSPSGLPFRWWRTAWAARETFLRQYGGEAGRADSLLMIIKFCCFGAIRSVCFAFLSLSSGGKILVKQAKTMKTKRKEKKLTKSKFVERRRRWRRKNRSVTNKWWRWCQHLHLLRKSRLWWWSGGQNANSRGRSSLRLPSSGIGVIIIISRRRRRWGQGNGTGRQQRGYEIMKQNRLHDNDYPANNWNRNEKRSALAQRECEWEWNWNCLLPRFVPLIPPFLHLSFTLSPCVCVCWWLSAFKNLGQSSEHKQNLDDDGYLTMLNNKWVDTYTHTHTYTYMQYVSLDMCVCVCVCMQVIYLCVCACLGGSCVSVSLGVGVVK